MNKDLDVKCYELAEAALADRPNACRETTDELAGQIAETISDFLNYSFVDIARKRKIIPFRPAERSA